MSYTFDIFSTLMKLVNVSYFCVTSTAVIKSFTCLKQIQGVKVALLLVIEGNAECGGWQLILTASEGKTNTYASLNCYRTV